MNIRQQKYKRNRLLGMNQRNAAIAAGYSLNYARNARPEKVVKGCLADAFEQAGFTDKKIIEHALAGLEAEKTFVADKVVLTSEDWNARHKYFDTILKLAEKLKDQINVQPAQVILMRFDNAGNQSSSPEVSRRADRVAEADIARF